VRSDHSKRLHRKFESIDRLLNTVQKLTIFSIIETKHAILSILQSQQMVESRLPMKYTIQKVRIEIATLERSVVDFRENDSLKNCVNSTFEWFIQFQSRCFQADL
jgi:hypothetical protein